MFDVVSFWLDMGVDGFRLDVINMIFKDKKLRNDNLKSFFSNKQIFSRNQPESYEILRDFRSLLDKYPNKTSVGEIYAPPPGSSKLATSFLGNGSDMLHLVFDFSLIFSVWKASSYYKIINRYYRYIPPAGWACFFLSNHDMGRNIGRTIFSFHKHAKAKLHAVLLLTLKGTPFIYYGDEIGMENADIPKHQIRDLYGKFFYPFYKGRDGSRTPMQWNDTDFAGFSTTETYLPVNKNYKSINVETESKDENSIYSIYKRMITLRKQHDILQTGDIEFLNKGNKNILIFSRYLENKKIIVLLNFGFRRKKIENNKVLIVLFSTHKKNMTEIDGTIFLEAFEGLVLESKKF